MAERDRPTMPSGCVPRAPGPVAAAVALLLVVFAALPSAAAEGGKAEALAMAGDGRAELAPAVLAPPAAEPAPPQSSTAAWVPHIVVGAAALATGALWVSTGDPLLLGGAAAALLYALDVPLTLAALGGVAAWWVASPPDTAVMPTDGGAPAPSRPTRAAFAR